MKIVFHQRTVKGKRYWGKMERKLLKAANLLHLCRLFFMPSHRRKLQFLSKQLLINCRNNFYFPLCGLDENVNEKKWL